MRKYEHILAVGDSNKDISVHISAAVTYLIYMIPSRSLILYQELHV